MDIWHCDALGVYSDVRDRSADTTGKKFLRGYVDEFTSQLYFDDALTDRVHATAPYSSKKGQRLLNARDMIYREGGTQLMLPVVESGSRYSRSSVWRCDRVSRRRVDRASSLVPTGA